MQIGELDAAHQSLVLGSGQVAFNSFTKRFVVGDGLTAGGAAVAGGIPIAGLADPTSYGAVGDGTTDDTAAFAKIPAGSYLFAATGKNYRVPSFYGAATMKFIGAGKINGIPVDRLQRYPEKRPILFPAEMGWKPPLAIYYDRGRWVWEMDYRTIFDRGRSKLGASAVINLYMAPNGAVGAPGTQSNPLVDPTDAYHAMAAAAASSSFVVLHVQPGLYAGWRYGDLTTAETDALSYANVTMVCEDWQALVPGYRRAYSLTGASCDKQPFSGWTAIGGGKYTSSASGVLALIDASNRLGQSTDLMQQLAVAANASAIVAGSFYADPGTNLVTVQTRDGRQPDSLLWAVLDIPNYGFIWPRTKGSLYCDSIDCIGQATVARTPTQAVPISTPSNSRGTGTICYVDCGSFYNGKGSGFRHHDQAWTVYIRCAAAYVFNDCYSTACTVRPVDANGNSLRPKHIELDCRGHDAGTASFWASTAQPYNHNISTTHDGIDLVSVNTSGYAVYGPAFGYVNGVRAFVTGGRSGPTLQAGNGTIEANSDNTSDRSGMGWFLDLQTEPVDGVTNGNRDIQVTSAGDVINLSNYKGGLSINGLGTVQEWTPSFGMAPDAADYPIAYLGNGPIFTTAPTVSGSPIIGQALTANTGTVANGTVTSVQWLRGGSAIDGAIGTTYTLVDADYGYAISALVGATGTVIPTATIAATSNSTSKVAPLENAATTAFANALANAPARARRSAYDALISGLVADGAWPFIDHLFLLRADDNQAARVSLKKPSLSLSAQGTLTFTAGLGYAGDGSTGHLLWPELADASGNSYSLNRAMLGVWCPAAGGTGRNSTAPQIGTKPGTNRGAIRVPSSGQSRGLLNRQGGTYTLSSATASITGHRAVVRSDANTEELYVNGAPSTINAAAPSVSVLSPNTICLLRDGSDYNNDTISAAYCGGLPASNVDAFMAAIHSRLNTFLTTP